MTGEDDAARLHLARRRDADGDRPGARALLEELLSRPELGADVAVPAAELYAWLLIADGQAAHAQRWARYAGELAGHAGGATDPRRIRCAWALAAALHADGRSRTAARQYRAVLAALERAGDGGQAAAVRAELAAVHATCPGGGNRAADCPEPTDPSPADPAPVDREQCDPEPADSAPTDPRPTDRERDEAQQSDPEPTDREPTDPRPTGPEPTDRERDGAEPADSTDDLGSVHATSRHSGRRDDRRGDGPADTHAPAHARAHAHASRWVDADDGRDTGAGAFRHGSVHRVSDDDAQPSTADAAAPSIHHPTPVRQLPAGGRTRRRVRRYAAAGLVALAGSAATGWHLAADGQTAAGRAAVPGLAAGAGAAATTPRPAPGRPTPPARVRLVDRVDSVLLTWSYPPGAEGPVLVAGGRAGGPHAAFGSLPAGSSRYTVHGLRPAVTYCFTVAVVYSADAVAAADRVCTRRAHAAAPGSTGPAARRRPVTLGQ